MVRSYGRNNFNPNWVQTMNPLVLFTDGSVHPPSGIGCGAVLAITDVMESPEVLKDLVRIKRFEQTSSTRLELQTLIWALQHLDAGEREITVYSDSQNIVGLPGRRSRLEARNYCSGKDVPLKNADLYRAFFDLTDTLRCTFVKVKGHKRTHHKSDIDRLFTLVDRASRQALRGALEQ